MRHSAALTDLRLSEVDVRFDARTDTPPGRDPDAFSPTLRAYHRLLWSKPLPDGSQFTLTAPAGNIYLLHESRLGRFVLSSDCIVTAHSKKLQRLLAADNDHRIRRARHRIRWTVGATIIFPAVRVFGQQTINQHRGIHHHIHDRFDLTLECIRRYYVGGDSPLSSTLDRYADFFALFKDFDHYVDFFFLQDLIRKDGSVRFYLPFDDFGPSPLPRDIETYLSYSQRQALFALARSRRIGRYVRKGLTTSQRLLLDVQQAWRRATIRRPR